MDATIFNENGIKTILVNVVKELYPFYREIKPWVAIQMDVDSIEQGIRILVKSYFNIR